eukprot:GDKJ01021335.1.p1 GENE.GDKJ01021335.1~~GDKJ01021335.1.p1  ORF type:complete len:1114 (+),score=269.82 GDKJ01021335.1:1-3342(+)
MGHTESMLKFSSHNLLLPAKITLKSNFNFNRHFVRLSCIVFNSEKFKPYTSQITHFCDYLPNEILEQGVKDSMILTGNLNIPALQTNLGVIDLHSLPPNFDASKLVSEASIRHKRQKKNPQVSLRGFTKRNRAMFGDQVYLKLHSLKSQEGQYVPEIVGVASRSANLKMCPLLLFPPENISSLTIEDFIPPTDSTKKPLRLKAQHLDSRYPMFELDLRPLESDRFHRDLDSLLLHRKAVESLLAALKSTPSEDFDPFKGVVVEGRFEDWPTDNLNPSARLIDFYGPYDTPLTMSRVFMAMNRLDSKPLGESIKNDLEKRISTGQWLIDAESDPKRVDLRNSDSIFTIDPSTARDLDDAIGVKFLFESEDGISLVTAGSDMPKNRKLCGIQVSVAVADVSHFVEYNTPIDKDASHRCTSVYLETGVTPMLPHVLSSDVCSLLPNVDRLAMVITFTLDTKGSIINYPIPKQRPSTTASSPTPQQPFQHEASTETSPFKLEKAIIRSRARLAYEEAQALINANPICNPLQTVSCPVDPFIFLSDPSNINVPTSLKHIPSDVIVSTLIAARLSLLRSKGEAKKKLAIHSIQRVNLITDRLTGEPIGINNNNTHKPSSQNGPQDQSPSSSDELPHDSECSVAHGLIEQLMLVSNHIAATQLLQLNPLGVLLRVHPSTSAQATEALLAALPDESVRLQVIEAAGGETDLPSLLSAVADCLPALQVEQISLSVLSVMKEAQYKATKDLLTTKENPKDPNADSIPFAYEKSRSVDSIGHWGVALPSYMHFTSPIRRYADLVAHRILSDGIYGRASAEQSLSTIAERCSLRSKAANDAALSFSSWMFNRYLTKYFPDGMKTSDIAVVDIFTTRKVMEELFAAQHEIENSKICAGEKEEDFENRKLDLHEAVVLNFWNNTTVRLFIRPTGVTRQLSLYTLGLRPTHDTLRTLKLKEEISSGAWSRLPSGEGRSQMKNDEDCRALSGGSEERTAEDSPLTPPPSQTVLLSHLDVCYLDFDEQEKSWKEVPLSLAPFTQVSGVLVPKSKEWTVRLDLPPQPFGPFFRAPIPSRNDELKKETSESAEEQVEEKTNHSSQNNRHSEKKTKKNYSSSKKNNGGALKTK